MSTKQPGNFWKSNKLLLLSALILGALNVFILLNRQQGFTYTPYQTLAEIYNTDAMLFVKNLKIENNTAEISFSKSLSSGKYLLKTDSTSSQLLQTANYQLIVPLSFGYHQYTIHSLQDSLNFKINIDLYDTVSSKAELLYCSLPGPSKAYTPIQIWQQGFKDFSPEEMSKGKVFISQIKGWDEKKTDYEKVLLIAKTCAGLCNIPTAKYNPETLKQLSPWQQLQTARQCNTSLNCGSYTLLFHYLCSAANIPERGVILGENGVYGWQYGVHFFNEAFIKEVNQWVVFDGLANMILPHDSAGHFLDAVDIKKIATLQNYSPNITAYQSVNESLTSVPINKYQQHLNYYFRNQSAITFTYPGVKFLKTRWDMLREFYSFEHNNSVYSETEQNDYLRIYIKLLCFYGFWILVLVLPIRFLLFKKQSKLS